MMKAKDYIIEAAKVYTDKKTGEKAPYSLPPDTNFTDLKSFFSEMTNEELRKCKNKTAGAVGVSGNVSDTPSVSGTPPTVYGGTGGTEYIGTDGETGYNYIPPPGTYMDLSYHPPEELSHYPDVIEILEDAKASRKNVNVGISRDGKFLLSKSKKASINHNHDLESSNEDFLYPDKQAREDLNYRIDYENFKGILDKYLSTNIDKDLFHFLVKSGIINRLSACCNFILIRGAREEEEGELIKSRSALELKRIFNNIKTICNITDIPSILRKRMPEIINRLFYSSPHNIFSAYIDNSDYYSEVIEEFLKRGIDIDEELAKPINFKDLRSNGIGINVFYHEVFNELIFIPEAPRGRQTAAYPSITAILKNKPIIVSKSGSLKDFEAVNINGVSYRKSIFESMVEIDLDGFLSNLKIESMLYDNESSVIEDTQSAML